MKYLKIVMHIIFLINNILECWKYLVNIKVATTMKCIMIPCVFSHDSSLLWVTDDIYNIYLTLPFAVHPSGHWGAAHVNNHVTQSRFVVIKQVSMFLLLYSLFYFLFFFFAQYKTYKKLYSSIWYRSKERGR